MLVVVLLAVVQLSYGAVPMMRNIMDPQLIELDDIGGFIYDLPEDDPLFPQNRFSSLGGMPIFTLMESARNRENSKLDGVPEKVKLAESKRIIDGVLNRLELARMKLEKGNGNIETDVEKAIQNLKILSRPSRPDIREVMDSLQGMMAIGQPIMMPRYMELATTGKPESQEKIEVSGNKPDIDRQSLIVRVISNNKPSELEEKPTEKNPPISVQSTSTEKSTEEGSSVPSESSKMSKEKYEASKPPFEIKMKEDKDSSFDGEDLISSYKAKLTWKAAGIV